MPAASAADVAILRDLAQRYADACADPVMDERRDLWRDKNSLVHTRPLIYLRGGNCWGEVPEITERQVHDPALQPYEHTLRHMLYWMDLGDDSIFEPWLTVRAVCKCSGWGLAVDRHSSGQAGGSWKTDYAIKDPADVEKMIEPYHEIDQEATAEHVSRITDAVGDILGIDIDRGPAYRMWSGDLSTDLGYLRGIENVMLDMIDRPEWLHALCAKMRDGILRTHAQAEAAGDWSLTCHQNQAMPYCRDLADPAMNTPAQRSELWGYMAAQEMTLISPAMHDEFILQYQLPIMEPFGLTAYGCCEDLTQKIDMLRKVPNLRRIAVAPVADVAQCAEQIGTDYVMSYRPNPAEMVCCGYDPDHVRKVLTADLDACRGLHVDITLKDVNTIQHEPARLVEWTKLVREIADHYA